MHTCIINCTGFKSINARTCKYTYNHLSQTPKLIMDLTQSHNLHQPHAFRDQYSDYSRIGLTPPALPTPSSSALLSPWRPYLLDLIKLPARCRGCCWRWRMEDRLGESVRERIMNAPMQLQSASEKERCYNRCGQTFSVSRQGSVQPLISCFNAPSPSLPCLPHFPSFNNPL